MYRPLLVLFSLFYCLQAQAGLQDILWSCGRSVLLWSGYDLGAGIAPPPFTRARPTFGRASTLDSVMELDADLPIPDRTRRVWILEEESRIPNYLFLGVQSACQWVDPEPGAVASELRAHERDLAAQRASDQVREILTGENAQKYGWMVQNLSVPVTQITKVGPKNVDVYVSLTRLRNGNHALEFRRPEGLPTDQLWAHLQEDVFIMIPAAALNVQVGVNAPAGVTLGALLLEMEQVFNARVKDARVDHPSIEAQTHQRVRQQAIKVFFQDGVPEHAIKSKISLALNASRTPPASLPELLAFIDDLDGFFGWNSKAEFKRLVKHAWDDTRDGGALGGKVPFVLEALSIDGVRVVITGKLGPGSVRRLTDGRFTLPNALVDPIEPLLIEVNPTRPLDADQPSLLQVQSLAYYLKNAIQDVR